MKDKNKDIPQKDDKDLEAIFEELDREDEEEDGEEESTSSAGKIRPTSVLIVSIVTLIAMLCAVIVGMFAPAIGLAARGTINSIFSDHTKAANAYSSMATSISEVELPETDFFDINSLRGANYHVLKAIFKMSPIQGTDLLVNNIPADYLNQFPYSKFSRFVENSKLIEAFTGTVNEMMNEYFDDEKITVQEKEAFFKKVDEYVAQNPDTPLWFVAVVKNDVAEGANIPAEERLTYFDNVTDMEDGFDQYSFYIAALYKQLNMTDELIKIYDERIKRNSNDFEAILGKGKLLIASGNQKEADKAIKAAKGQSGVYDALRIEMMRWNRQYDEATATYTDYSQKQTEKGSAPYPEAARQIAIVMLLQGDYAGAYETAFEAVNVEGYDSSEYYNVLRNTVILAAALSGDVDGLLTQEGIVLTEEMKTVADAEDKKAALEKLFLEGKGDLS